jgi:hypothetical protein
MWYFCIILLLSFLFRASSIRCLCAASSRSRSFCLFAGSFRLSRASSLSIALARFLIALRLSVFASWGFDLCGRLGRCRFRVPSSGPWPEESASGCGRFLFIFAADKSCNQTLGVKRRNLPSRFF